MQPKNLEDIQQFVEESEQEFQERLERYLEREAQAQEDFNAFIYGDNNQDEED